ncbi:MAG: sigma-70 family RNA polymerase sigma factor [Planctomycetes bacterium]|nr:sigma-70 family RNA polymerase sigma factor [Planctomycetota bacterium]
MTPDGKDTCWTMLRAAAAGDKVARSTFTLLYAATIRDYLGARWRGRHHLADVDDASQEVFVECLRPEGVLQRADPGRGDFRGLLYGVARNVACRFEKRALERGRLRPEDSAWLEQVAADDAGQATMFDRSWARAMVFQAKKRHRELAGADGEAGQRRLDLLERRFGGDEMIRDIAASWGVPAQEVHNAYRKARTEFYRCLREVVAAHAPAGVDLDEECRKLLAALG